MSPLLRSLIFTIVVPGSVTGILPWLIVSRSTEPVLDLGPIRVAGWIPLIGGVALYLRCALDFSLRGRGTPNPLDPPRTFVATGPYRVVRNPMYAAVLSVLAGEVLLTRSPVLLVYLAMVALLFHLVVVLYEEPVLRRRFGAEYDDYLQRVPRWIPRPRPR